MFTTKVFVKDFRLASVVKNNKICLIVTDDLPGSHYDRRSTRVSMVSMVTGDLPGSHYDG